MNKTNTYQIILVLINFIGTNSIFSEDSSHPKINFKEKIVILIENSNPLFQELNVLISQFSLYDYSVFFLDNINNYDIHNLNKENSPFSKDIFYVMKISMINFHDNYFDINIEANSLQNAKVVSKFLSITKSNLKLLVAESINLLNELIGNNSAIDPVIISVDKSKFSFLRNDFPGLKRGDEVFIQYKKIRLGISQSEGIVEKFADNLVIAKDINKKVEIGDKVLHIAPNRNRFSINLGLIIPTLGEYLCVAKYNQILWESHVMHWPAGLKVELEYERFLISQMVFTTILGLDFDGILGTYFATGIGYRFLIPKWEFIPYFRLALMYEPLMLRLKEGKSGDLQGIVLKFGFDIGMSILKRISSIVFIGLNVGVQYFPLDFFSVMTNSSKIKPLWRNKDSFTDLFPMVRLYPYISVKTAILF